MLTISQLDAFYGKKQVLFGIDMALAERRIAAVIGPNGAGKSTVLRAVFGLGPQREGSIRFDEKDLSRAAPPENIAAGIAFVPQGARVFRDLSVFENLRMGGYTLDSGLLPARIDEVLSAFPILRERRVQTAGALSGGERQMLAFGMALMLHPKLLLIDEPSIGLAPKLVAQIFDTIVRIRDEFGTAVLIVEQQAQQILRIADQVFVIRAGRLISQGPVESYRGEDALRQVYLSEHKAEEREGSRS
jgi:branched-chain amino acid transport system ATP-binding protein